MLAFVWIHSTFWRFPLLGFLSNIGIYYYPLIYVSRLGDLYAFIKFKIHLWIFIVLFHILSNLMALSEYPTALSLLKSLILLSHLQHHQLLFLEYRSLSKAFLCWFAYSSHLSNWIAILLAKKTNTFLWFSFFKYLLL